MVIEILFVAFCVICVISFAFFAWLAKEQLEDERKEWREERSKLLDRIQAGSFTEYKAQERAEKPVKRIEKDSTTKQLEKERWL